MNTFFKQPQDVLDYDLDFSLWLSSDDTIQSAVAATDAPTQLAVDSVSSSAQAVKVWLSGGLDGKTYKVTVTATTAQGRVKELDFKIRVKDQ